ncbi:MAG: (2E,6E)-farnesyl diphosphate synthase [Acidiferrobacterales bacterium]
MSHLEQTLRQYQRRVEDALDRRLPRSSEPPQQLHEAMRYATLDGGKRVRACLVYAAGAALDVEATVLDAPACAVELIHSYSLVHDDLPCMDNDDLRRGKPTCHKAFDQATALLVGDALQTLAFEILAKDSALGVNAQRRTQMIASLAEAAGSRGMAGGQAIDLGAVGRALALPELEDMHRRKTGALIRAAVRLGALGSEGAGAEALDALDHYARHIGLAFQITDDVLDVEGDAQALGKTPGADEAHNKPTYPSLLGLQQAKARCAELTDSAVAALVLFGESADALAGLARYIVDRRH